MAIVLSVLLRFTASHYSFGIFWPLYCLSFYALRLLITPLVSFGHCIVCPCTLYGFSLLLWYLLVIVLSVLLRFYGFSLLLWYLLAFVLSVLLRFTASHYSFGIFWPLYCLSFYALRLLITPLVSFGHCIVCPSTLYGFSLLLWYLLAIALSVLLRFTASHYSFGIFWPLYCLSFYALRLLITPLIYFGHCIVCPSTLYGFSLPLWYLVVIVLSVLLRFTASHYSFDIFWSLYCLSFYALRLLITPLVSFGHCIVCPSTLYGFSLLLSYLLAIALFVLLRFTASHYPFGIFWPLYCLSFYALRLLITPLVSFGHCIVCPTLYGFSLPLWYLLAIVLSVLLRFTASHYSTDIFWSLYCLSFYALRLLIIPLVSFGHCIVCHSTLYGFSLLLWYLLVIVLSVLLRFYGFSLLLWYLLAIVLSVLLGFTASHYPFGIFWPLYCLSFYALRLLITLLVSFDHCIVCPSTLYGFSLHLWYLLVIVLSVLLRFTASHYSFGIFWPLYCLSFYALRLLITSLVSFGHCIVCPSTLYGFSLLLWYLLAIVLSVFLRLRLLITPLVSFGHCIVCPSTLSGFSLLLWYLLAIVLSVLLRFTASHYTFGIFWPLYCLSFYALRLLITPLVSFGHCIVCPCKLYGFSLLLWYLLVIVLSVLLRFTASHYSFGIFWPLYCLSFYALRLLITPLVSFGHCIVCPSTLYGFSLLLSYLLAIALSLLLRFTASHYSFGIFWPLYCLSFYALRLLITLLVSFGHCIVCPTLYGFSLPLWYLLAIVLSVLLRFTASHYSIDIFWSLYCLSFYALRLLITPLVSFGHCIVCHSTLYGFSLHLWYLLVIVLSVLLRFTASHYTFGIFWSLYCLSFYALRLLITPLVSFGHCIVCPSRLHGFSLPFWYLLAIVLSVLLRFTASHYPFGIFWPLYCLSFDALRLLITPLVSFGHCIVCPSTLYGFSLLLWYLLAIVLSVLLRFTASHYSFGIFWSLYCLSFYDLRLLITPLVSFGHCIVCPSTLYGFSLHIWYLLAIVLSILLRFTASHYSFGIFWSLYCLSLYALRLLITPLVSFGHCIVCPSTLLRLLITPLVSFGHCIVCPSTLHGFSLLFWYLLAIVLSVLLRFTASHYSFGIFWPLYCLSFYALRLLITLWYLLAIALSVLLRFTASHYSFRIFWRLHCLSFYALRLLITPLVSFGHCIVCPSTLYGFSLLLWYLLAIALSVLRFTASHYPFGIFWPLYCLSFYALRLLITPLIYFGHCIVCPSTLYASHYAFGIFWSLYCLSFYALRLLITPLVSFGHCIVCPSTLYGFSLHLWYLLVIVLSVFLRFTLLITPLVSFGHCIVSPSTLLRLLITPLVSFGHCIVCPSRLHGFSLPFWYLLAIVLSVLLRFTASHYPFGIFWPLYCLSFYALRLLITPLVSFGHCIVCPSTLYGFSLLLWYLLAIVLSVLLRFTASHYFFGIFWSLYCLSFYALRLLITPLVSFGHCIVCPSTLYGFSLHIWYLLAIVLSVLLRFTASHYSFGIFWSLYCLSL